MASTPTHQKCMCSIVTAGICTISNVNSPSIPVTTYLEQNTIYILQAKGLAQLPDS